MGSLNACELEIDLFCRGMRVPDDVSLAGARNVTRTRAGLGSGLEVVLPTASHAKKEIWVNVPVVERFATHFAISVVWRSESRLPDRRRPFRTAVPGPTAQGATVVCATDVA